MITYKQFLKLLEENETKFTQDNPGGEWLKNKQDNAEKTYKKMKGMVGAQTGSFNKIVKLPVSSLIKVAGASGEEKFRTNTKKPKYQRLEKEIGHPSKFDTQKNPISVYVNHRGVPHVYEGNHRLGYAHNNGIKDIHAEVRYYNGGEQHDDHDFSPKRILDYNK